MQASDLELKTLPRKNTRRPPTTPYESYPPTLALASQHTNRKQSSIPTAGPPFPKRALENTTDTVPACPTSLAGPSSRDCNCMTREPRRDIAGRQRSILSGPRLCRGCCCSSFLHLCKRAFERAACSGREMLSAMQVRPRAERSGAERSCVLSCSARRPALSIKRRALRQ